MANNLTPKGERFDFALDEPVKAKKTISLEETVRRAEGIKMNKTGPMSDRTTHAADAMSYMMDSMHREGYERERRLQEKHRMDNRRSGKSFRCILKALELASAGQRVMYVCDHRMEAERIFHKAMDVAGAYLSDFFEGQRDVGHRITFRNGGMIYFVDYDTHSHNCRTRGVDRSHEVIDDYNY